MLAGLQLRLALGLRRAAYSAGAGVAFLIGAAFMTVAAWIYLAETTSTQSAALIIGAVWFALGFILLGLSRLHRVPVAPPAAAPAPGTVPPTTGGFGLAQAFLFGLEAGRGTARRK